MKFSRAMLQKLAANPHYQFTDQELDEFEYYRSIERKHKTKFKKHPVTFDKNIPKLEDEEDEHESN